MPIFGHPWIPSHGAIRSKGTQRTMKKPAHRFAVATADPELQSAMKRAVSESEASGAVVLNRSDAVSFLDSDAVADDLRKSEANVLVVDLGGEGGDSTLTRFEALRSALPELRIVLIGPAVSTGELLELMRAGVSDYLAKPLENGALGGALERVTRGLSQRELTGGKAGRVIGFLGPKGGTGVTTTVTNVAIKLRKLTDKDVLLADLNAELGTASILLGVRPRYNFVELVKNLHRMDEDLLKSYVTPHESGVAFLPSPLTARDLEGVTRQRINEAMKLLKSQYDHVLLDLGNSMTPLAQAGLAVCDEVVVVLTAEVPSLRNAKRLMPVIAQSVNAGDRALRFIVNRYDAKVDIPLSQIRDTLGKDVFMTFPKVDEASTHAANVGRPLALEGTGKYEKALHYLGTEVAAPGSLNGVPKRATIGAGLLGRLRSNRGEKSGAKAKGKPAPAPADAGAQG